MIATHSVFPMYDFPEIAAAHDRLTRTVTMHAELAGLRAPLALTQICGYPLLRALPHVYDVLAAPSYDLAFCEPGSHRALIVVGSSTAFDRLEDLRGARFAVNALDSNTGMNLPRRSVASIASGRRFFSHIFLTSSHAASLDAVGNGEADAASIDCITFGLLAEHRPQAVARVRILAATAASPAPPFVIPRSTQARAKTILYEALATAIADADLDDVRRALHLRSITPATLETYEVIRRYEREAAALGYPELA